MFDWQEIVAVWFAFGGVWSLGLIVLIMVLGYVMAKSILTPTNPIERENYIQNKINIRSGKTPLRRFSEAVFILVFGFIATASFLIIAYKIFS